MANPETEAKSILDPILAAFRLRLETMLVNHDVTVYVKGAVEMMSWGRTQRGFPKVFEGPPMQEAINYANKRAARMVTEIDAETKDRLAKTIANAIKEKRGIDGLARDIRREFDDMGKVRSKLIARTETAEALSQGSFERGKAMGIKGKSWLTAGDSEVRDEHLRNEAAGIIPWDEPFPDGSMFPPGENPYNCRCVLLPAMLPER